jgi:hypothetical protein
MIICLSLQTVQAKVNKNRKKPKNRVVRQSQIVQNVPKQYKGHNSTKGTTVQVWQKQTVLTWRTQFHTTTQVKHSYKHCP